jgi:ATPase subunit of ABC transporter with duplicated ATPase domains
MTIDKITIQNFRNIENKVSFQLNPKFTVVIGINGKGKSTILHAIRIAAGAYLLGIPEAAKRHIWINEIRLKDFDKHTARQTPTIVKAEGSIDGKRLSKSWVRQIPEGMTKTTSSGEDVGEIRSIARNKYDLINKEGASTILVLADFMEVHEILWDLSLGVKFLSTVITAGWKCNTAPINILIGQIAIVFWLRTKKNLLKLTRLFLQPSVQQIYILRHWILTVRS